MTDVELPTAEEIVDAMTDAEVVVTTYPEGGRSVLAGDEFLDEIAASGEVERVKIATIPVGTTREAEVVAAALHLVQRDEMGEARVAMLQRMLDEVRRVN
jgi:hypothetical protein